MVGFEKTPKGYILYIGVFILVLLSALLVCPLTVFAEGVPDDSGFETGQKKEAEYTSFEMSDLKMPYSEAWPEDMYSFIHFPDTQVYTALCPEVFYQECQQVIDWQKDMNIRFVAHSGDIVDSSWSQQQWQNAVQGMTMLADAEIPRMVTAGNHDLYQNGDYSSFCKYLNTDSYVYANNYTEMFSYRGGEAQVQLVNVGNGRTWMFVGVGFNPTDEALAWAQSVMARYTSLPAVIVTHCYLKIDGQLENIGWRIASYLVDPFPNVHLILCGHNHTLAINVCSYDMDNDGRSDRDVYALLTDYQGDEDRKSGKFRILTVSESENLIYVRTFNPATGSFVDDEEYIIQTDASWF